MMVSGEGVESAISGVFQLKIAVYRAAPEWPKGNFWFGGKKCRMLCRGT